MKRILAVVCALAIMFTLAGCGEKRELYNVKLSKYVDLGEYKGIEVDLSSDEVKDEYDALILSHIIQNGFHEEESVTIGALGYGDIANINYVGKKDGVAFEGGSADNYDLTIGSGSFINGFEDGLVDVEIGSTVDLNLSFPENYSNEELSGAEVVFTVKVNSAKKAKAPEDYYKELGFKTLKEYTDNVTENSVKSVIMDKLFKSSEIKDYPEKDVEKIYDAQRTMMDKYYQNSYGMTLDSLIEAQGITAQEFKDSTIKEMVKPLMDEQMILYSVLDNEGIEVTNNEVELKITEGLNQHTGVDRETLIEYYGRYYFEEMVVREKAMEYLYDNAKIK